MEIGAVAALTFPITICSCDALLLHRKPKDENDALCRSVNATNPTTNATQAVTDG